MKLFSLAFGVVLIFMLSLSPAFADFDTGQKLFIKKNYAAALAEWKPLAEQGYPRAQLGMATLYNSGLGVPKNGKIAAKWIARAAELGFSDAQNLMANFYMAGLGVTKNRRTAFEWYMKAANNGYANAQYRLGLMYKDGVGAPRDNRKAIMWFKRSAKSNHPKASYILGTSYYFAKGVKKDHMEAHKWFVQAALSKQPQAATSMRVAAKTMSKNQIKASTLLARSTWKLNAIKKMERRRKMFAAMEAKFNASKKIARPLNVKKTQTTPKTGAKSSGTGSIKARLQKLKELKDAGLITKEEAAKKRKAILDSL